VVLMEKRWSTKENRKRGKGTSARLWFRKNRSRSCALARRLWKKGVLEDMKTRVTVSGKVGEIKGAETVREKEDVAMSKRVFLVHNNYVELAEVRYKREEVTLEEAGRRHC